MTILLSLIPFLLRNWKMVLIALALLGAAIVLERANMHGYQRRINEEKAQEIRLLTDRIATLSLITSLDTQRVTTDAKLNRQLDTLSRETPKNAGVCLDLDAARRVRAIGPGSKPVTAPVPALRHSIVLPWHSGRP